MKRHSGSLMAAAPRALALVPSFVSQCHAESGRDTSLFQKPFGVSATVAQTGDAIDRTNPFFQNLGTNGRTCKTCHQPGEGWGISVNGIRKRFNRSNGLDPFFRTVDGSNSPSADVSTVQSRRRAYSVLLNKGVIRVGLPVPIDAESELILVDDPYGFASAMELSLFRSPLPTTNLPFLTATMWDGREASLGVQANNATRTHAEGELDLTPDQRRQIVDFESSLYTAQAVDDQAGPLAMGGAAGGPQNLAVQLFYIGINDLRFGLPDESRRTEDMPLYTLRHKTTGADTRTTDPGVALLSGRWADIG